MDLVSKKIIFLSLKKKNNNKLKKDESAWRLYHSTFHRKRKKIIHKKKYSQKKIYDFQEIDKRKYNHSVIKLEIPEQEIYYCKKHDSLNQYK